MTATRFVNWRDVLGWDTLAAVERSRPYTVALLCPSGRSTSFAATTAHEAEQYAAGELKRDRALFGAVVCYGSRLVSRILPA